jgi:hypothetical protein
MYRTLRMEGTDDQLRLAASITEDERNLRINVFRIPSG